MTYYVINNNHGEEVGYFKSNLDLTEGGSVFAGLQDFVILCYSADEIKIGGLVIDLGVVNNISDLYSTQEWVEDGWQIVKPVEVHEEEDVKELYRKFQSTPAMEYIGGVDLGNDTEALSMIPKMDEDDMPF